MAKKRQKKTASSKHKLEIIVGVTGGIACYKSADLVSRFVKVGYTTHVVMTEAAARFVSPLTFQYLSGNKVYTHLFDSAEYSPEHISLADRADLVVVVPATANTIGKLATGVIDNLLTCTVYATKAPVLLAPAMNTQMLKHAVTEGNIRKLKKIGYHFIGPETGRLACGTKGPGRMSEPEAILKEAEKILSEI